jgi:catechol 2,3-dioxygenase-like lactoylglutathione lyase family enzyme
MAGLQNTGTLLNQWVMERAHMNWTLEVVVVPVSDVDRAKAFYADRLGFRLDHDTRIGEGSRVVQLTPPGSGCSIVVGEGLVELMEPGTLKGLQLVVPDIRAARAQLVERGVTVSEVQVMGENPDPVGDPLDNVGFVFFDDPDGNGWAVQQMAGRG